MGISIWRYSHLVLAAVSSIFLLVASITGVILAVEPIAHQTKGYLVSDLDEVTLAQTIHGLQENYDEVFSVEVESSGFVKTSVLTDDFETLDIYINPETGEQLGEVTKRPAVYTFATNLHRSLFLKSIGRFFVGFVSLMLFVIALTGLILIIKRQGGIGRLFSKVKKEYFEMRYHVIIGRWVLIPILIIALSGVYLSAEKFGILPEFQNRFNENLEMTSATEYNNPAEIPLFNSTPLSEIRKVDFPFSPDPEDYFQISLKDREIRVNQQTGEITASNTYPFIQIVSHFSLILHTGEGSVLWSVVLLIASGSLIFFMYSGFVMTWKRLKKSKVGKITNVFSKDEGEYIVLVGSETGNAYDFATRFFSALTLAGKKSHITELNNYEDFPSATHIIVFTSTYGNGEPPTNARKFQNLFSTVKQSNPILYSVVGLGSLEYPKYCAFANLVDKLLEGEDGIQPILPIYKINGADFSAFGKWAEKWSQATNVDLRIDLGPAKKKRLKKLPFEVIERTEINSDYTFLLKLMPKKKTKFQSGDLLSIELEESEMLRQYSIARMGKEILLSIKRHQFGKASNHLYGLQKGNILYAALEPNPEFHFPKKTKSAVLIANGTGIAPFLGMVSENGKSDIQLLWGTRTTNSSKLYDNTLGNNHSILSGEKKKLTIHRCYSREQNKKYVQDLVREQSEIILRNFENDGICMICGSISMQNDVLSVIDKIINENPSISMNLLLEKGQLKMDCY